MAKLIEGERLGRSAQLRLGVSAVVWDEKRTTILLTRRSDNGRWCLPSGAIEAGESVEEACCRETFEETGLRVSVTRLIGVYSSPHRVLEYGDGERYPVVSLCFEVRLEDGELTTNGESAAFQWCEPDRVDGIDLMEHHRERLMDAVRPSSAAVIR